MARDDLDVLLVSSHFEAPNRLKCYFSVPNKTGYDFLIENFIRIATVCCKEHFAHVV